VLLSGCFLQPSKKEIEVSVVAYIEKNMLPPFTAISHFKKISGERLEGNHYKATVEYTITLTKSMEEISKDSGAKKLPESERFRYALGLLRTISLFSENTELTYTDDFTFSYRNNQWTLLDIQRDNENE
jgi:hypothetical protein